MAERLGTAEEIETPSGKGAGDENFPVGSWLLPARLRPHVAAFYAVARAADDIADNPTLAADDKVRRLDRFEQAVRGAHPDDPALAKANRLRASLRETEVSEQHICDLIAAFKQDAVKLRYDDWEDLMGYCALSASPVGRYLLDLHGEDPAHYAASDALCDALQVLNHLQDCQADYRLLDRVYLPRDWMAQFGADVAELDGDRAGPAMRRVLDSCLASTDGLLAVARTLPGRLKSRRLAMESAVIVRLAIRLSRLLKRRDPLAGRVKLSATDFLWCGVRGIAAGALG